MYMLTYKIVLDPATFCIKKKKANLSSLEERRLRSGRCLFQEGSETMLN